MIGFNHIKIMVRLQNIEGLNHGIGGLTHFLVYQNIIIKKLKQNWKGIINL